jgi:hypothetical protein
MTVKDYLGDSVYVSFNGYMLTLYTDNGNGANNVIHLEPEVYGAFLRFVEKLKEQSKSP